MCYYSERWWLLAPKEVLQSLFQQLILVLIFVIVVECRMEYLRFSGMLATTVLLQRMQEDACWSAWTNDAGGWSKMDPGLRPTSLDQPKVLQ